MELSDHEPHLLQAGLHHAVLLRAMPVLRHDMSSPLSVMRMGLTLLKRQLQRGDVAPQDALARVAQLELQLTELSAHIRRLRQWDPQVNEQVPLKALALEAAALARPMLMVRGVDVEPVQEDAPDWSNSSLAPHSALYTLLAAIYHLAETPGATPQRIAVAPSGPHAVQITADGECTVPSDLHINDAAALPSGLTLNASAIACLADSHGAQADVSPRQVTLTLKAQRPAG
jgi:hypothetical protein